MLRRLVHNAYRVGTSENAGRLIKLAADPTIPDIVRQEALRLLEVWTEPFPVDQLTGHWRPLAKRDPETIRPVLAAALPQLLRQQGFLLTAALEMAGQYHLEISGLDNASLQSFVTNDQLPAQARATSLSLLIERKPADLGDLLAKSSGDASDEVALTALAAIAKLTPETALPALEAAVNSTNIRRAQKTWDILASLPGDAVDAIFLKNLNALAAANSISPFAISSNP